MRTRDRKDQPALTELTLLESLLKLGGELDPVRVTALRELAGALRFRVSSQARPNSPEGT